MTKTELISRVLALKANAYGRAAQGGGPPLSEVKHNGLTIWFYDPRYGLPPEERDRTHPLAIEIMEGPELPGQFKRLFRAYVDPTDLSDTAVKINVRGPWQEKIGAPSL